MLYAHEENKSTIIYEADAELEVAEALAKKHARGQSIQKQTMLTEYFRTMSLLKDDEIQYTYDIFPRFYKWDKQAKIWIKRPKEDKKMVVRIDNVSPSNRELFVNLHIN